MPDPWIILAEGDLVASDCTVLAHQCNCFQDMSCGVALAIRTRHPEAYRADQMLKWTPEKRLGGLSAGISPAGQRVIFNLYGQYETGPRRPRYTDYDKLGSSLEQMMEWIQRIARHHPERTAKLGMPYRLGCGRGGGDWPTVLSILSRVASTYERHIHLYRHTSSSSESKPASTGS